MLLTARDDLRHTGTNPVLAHPPRPKDLRRAGARLMKHAEKKMLDSDTAAAERPSLLLGVADRPSCRRGESLKHTASIPPRDGPGNQPNPDVRKEEVHVIVRRRGGDRATAVPPRTDGRTRPISCKQCVKLPRLLPGGRFGTGICRSKGETYAWTYRGVDRRNRRFNRSGGNRCDGRGTRRPAATAQATNGHQVQSWRPAFTPRPRSPSAEGMCSRATAVSNPRHHAERRRVSAEERHRGR